MARSLQIGRVERKADIAGNVVLDNHILRVAHLDRIAADRVKTVAGEDAPLVALRGVERMRPQSVAEDFAEGARFDLEVGAAFLDQDAAGCVVAAGGVARAAIFHAHPADVHVSDAADQDGESSDIAEADVIHVEGVDGRSRDAIVCGECRKGTVVGGEALPHFKRGAIAIDGEIVQPDVAAPNDDRGGASEIRGHVESRALTRATQFRCGRDENGLVELNRPSGKIAHVIVCRLRTGNCHEAQCRYERAHYATSTVTGANARFPSHTWTACRPRVAPGGTAKLNSYR